MMILYFHDDSLWGYEIGSSFFAQNKFAMTRFGGTKPEHGEFREWSMIWHEEEVGKHQPNALFLIYPWIQGMNQRAKTFFEKLE